jgi:hypothetical protein
MTSTAEMFSDECDKFASKEKGALSRTFGILVCIRPIDTLSRELRTTGLLRSQRKVSVQGRLRIDEQARRELLGIVAQLASHSGHDKHLLRSDTS